jgi:uncharacterized protein YkwD
MIRAGTPLFAALAAAASLLAAGCSGEITLDQGDDDDDAPRADGGGLPPGSPDGAPSSGADATPPPPPDAAPDYLALSPQEQELFDTINAERVAMGLVAVELRPDLNCAADRHSADIGATQTCTHTGSDGSSPGDRVAECPGGAGWSGEIVACGQSTPRSAVDAWIGSPGHNAIMFDGGQRYIGVAMSNNFWTAIFDR